MSQNIYYLVPSDEIDKVYDFRSFATPDVWMYGYGIKGRHAQDIILCGVFLLQRYTRCRSGKRFHCRQSYFQPQQGSHN